MRRALVIMFGLCLAGVASAQPTTDTPQTTPQPNTTTEPVPTGEEGNNAEEEKPPINWYHLHYGKDEMGGPKGDGKIGDRPLGPDEKEGDMSPPFLLAVLNFVILVGILIKFGRPVARNMAETRSDTIKTALDEAARLRDQAQAKLDEYSAKLSAADAEIKTMIDGMRADAEADRKRVIADAEAQAVALKKEAEDRITVEIERARHALAREVASAAAGAAEKLIAQKLTTSDQTKLVDTFITDVAKPGGKPQERA